MIEAVGYNPSRRVITAALKSGTKTLRRLSNSYATPKDAFSHDWFAETVPSFPHFPSAFPNLRSLEIAICKSKDSSVPLPRHERMVCEWLEVMGGVLEYVTRAVNLPHMTDLPKTKGLPRVLQLRSIGIDFKNLLGLLETCKDTLEEVKLLSCKALELKEGVFKLLKFLRGGVKGLRIFEAGFKDDKVRRERYYPIKLYVNGAWDAENTKCVVRTKARQTLFHPPNSRSIVTYDRFVVEKSVRREVYGSDTAEGFWRGLLDRMFGTVLRLRFLVLCRVRGVWVRG